jgi:predicted dehydrogenase
MSTPNLNRRQFLGQSAAGAALAFSSAAAARAVDGANERIRVAVMGTNGRGQALAKGFALQKDAEVVYICDVDQRAIAKGMKAVESAQTAAPEGIGDFRKALDDKKVDVLAIAAPDFWHGPATIMACAAGKHVYVEKPASHNGQEGQMMIAAARKNNRVVQMGNQRRSGPGVIEAVGLLKSGEIGRVLFARGWINSTRPNIKYGKPAPVPAYLDYELWQGPCPDRPYMDNLLHYNWHWFWHYGTGELGNNGIHALDVCRWGLGVDYPQRVVCGGGKFSFDDDQETPDTQIATFNFGDKAINWEHRTWNKRGFEGDAFGVVFYGEKANMVITGSEYKIYNMNGEELTKAPLKTNDSLHFANFLECIRDGKRPNSDIEEGVKSTALCHLGNIAYRTGRTVNFDTDKRVIVGDEDAAKLWTREYRPGWEPRV